MMDRTFPVTVDGVGSFVFRRRAMRDQIKIQAEATRILGGPLDAPDTDARLAYAAMALATLGALTVTAPAGWSLDDADPLDEESFDRVYAVYNRLKDEEARFRGGAGAERAPVGA